MSPEAALSTAVLNSSLDTLHIFHGSPSEVRAFKKVWMVNIQDLIKGCKIILRDREIKRLTEQRKEKGERGRQGR